MLEKVITTVLVVIVLFSLTFFLQKYHFISPNLKEDFYKMAGHYNIFNDPYKDVGLPELLDELGGACEESSFENIDGLVGAIKQRAELVIVGKLDFSSQQGQISGIDKAKGKAYYNISVESVERGSYTYDTIQIYMGDYTSEGEGGAFFYPMGVKLNYRIGDRIRIFINYSPDTGEYVVPAGYFGMEPLPSQD